MFGADRVEDAVSDAFEDMLRFPDRIERAWTSGGTAAVAALLRKIAWRKARGAWVRCSHQRELPTADIELASPVCPAGQERSLAARRALNSLPAISAATTSVHAAAVTAAVLDKLDTGDSDGAVARRHGIRREYLNRAKRQLQEAAMRG